MLDLSHKKLEVYKQSLSLLKSVYALLAVFPIDEKFSLVSQMRRAAISVCSNIAEGASRVTKKEKKRYFEMARSSVVELDTQLEISILQHYIKECDCTETETFLLSTFRMLSKMINNLQETI